MSFGALFGFEEDDTTEPCDEDRNGWIVRGVPFSFTSFLTRCVRFVRIVVTSSSVISFYSIETPPGVATLMTKLLRLLPKPSSVINAFSLNHCRSSGALAHA